MAQAKKSYLEEMENLLRITAKHEASDLHMKVGAPPYLRIHGTIRTLDMDSLTAESVQGMVYSLLNEEQLSRFEKTGDLDLAYSLAKTGRFRINVFRQRGTIGTAIRRVNVKIPTFEELNLPVDMMKKISSFRDGLVIISGITSAGKSTTLAAMLGYINATRKCHIVTIEDPIEYLYQDDKAFLDQREVGIDVESFNTALKYVVRQDPDVILIGELRDEESFQAGLTAAETGHLVFGTVHSSSCAQTFGRILDLFSADRQDQIRQGLRFNLRAIVCQMLLPAKDKEVRAAPAIEILLSNPIVRKLINEKEDAKLNDVMRSSSEEGMQDFIQSLCRLVKSGMVEERVAMSYAPNPEALKMLLQGIVVDEGRTIVGV